MPVVAVSMSVLTRVKAAAGWVSAVFKVKVCPYRDETMAPLIFTANVHMMYSYCAEHSLTEELATH